MEDQKISTEDMQAKMLEMLLYFQKICEENDLTFYLCGGCLIGALRHKGFVPWDDDIDVFMPRPDYERLKKVWMKHADTKHYSYCRTDDKHNYHDCGASIRDNETTFINRHSINEDICHGLALEIMPIDGCPSMLHSRVWQLLNAMTFSLFNAQRLPDNKGKAIRTLTGIVYKLVPSKKVRYHIWKNAEREMTKYSFDDCRVVTELVGSIKGMLIPHPKRDFAKVVYKEFEGHKIPVMYGYERYLRKIWGDYMQLPPVEARVAKHDAVHIDLNTSYKAYEGIYYFPDRSEK